MADLREAAQQALEALEGELPGWRTPAQENAITALRAALEQPEPEQEPVAWLSLERERAVEWTRAYQEGYERGSRNAQLEPRREWQSLTDEEREQATGWSVEHIEAALKERNT